MAPHTTAHQADLTYPAGAARQVGAASSASSASSAAVEAVVRPYRVGLVGCASAKLQRAAPARELYTSQLFRKASAYAEATCDRWYVLSGAYGLVRPDQVIEPYDVKLGTNTRSAPPIHQWASRVQGQLAAELASVSNVVLVALAGEQYRTVLFRCPWEAEIPMKGLGIGEQLGWLTRELELLRLAAG